MATIVQWKDKEHWSKDFCIHYSTDGIFKSEETIMLLAI